MLMVVWMAERLPVVRCDGEVEGKGSKRGY